MTDKHTPGPWHIRKIERSGIVGFTVDTKDSEIEICEIYPKPQSQVAVKQANARLISAAPDLLVALENLLSARPYEESMVPAINEARAAIAKARGES